MTNGKCKHCDRTFEIRSVENGQTRCPHCLKINGELGARKRWIWANPTEVHIYELRVPAYEMREFNRAAEFKSSGNVSGGDVIEEILTDAARKIGPSARFEFIDYREETEVKNRPAEVKSKDPEVKTRGSSIFL